MNRTARPPRMTPPADQPTSTGGSFGDAALHPFAVTTWAHALIKWA